ncbi:MAG: DUF72 domain-containing protein [Planctomycetaceae bacterium]|nr:DUF72 domain-containing protein [Planctomycetaceae bacterium]
MDTSKIKVGIAGWSYADWRGIVYPNSRTDMLSYAAQFIDAVEINSTFYRPAMAEDSRTWLRRTQSYPDFFFTAKLHQDFTHGGIFDDAFINAFKEGLTPLLEAGKLRHLLAQFRFDFDDRPDHRARLENIVELFGELCPLIVEVRHHSWQQPDSAAFLQALEVGVCDRDWPVGRDSYNPKRLEPIGHYGYFRMHGRNRDQWPRLSGEQTYDYFYPPHELEEILQKIETLAEKCRTYTLIANNHYRGAELANAIQLKAMLTGNKQRFPEGLLVQYPDLMEYASNAILFR